MKVRYLGHPVMFPRMTWSRWLSCLMFGHDWIEWYPGAEPRCYTCGLHISNTPEGK